MQNWLVAWKLHRHPIIFQIYFYTSYQALNDLKKTFQSVPKNFCIHSMQPIVLNMCFRRLIDCKNNHRRN